MPDRARAAEVPISAGMSPSISGSHFVHEALGKQRANGPVDQAGGQGFLLGGAPLALEEAPGNPPGGVEFFLVVDGQRKERLARHRLATRHGCHQDHGAAHRDDHGAIGLAGDPPGFDGDPVVTELKRFH
jgi:hypothetical protein